MSQADSEDKKSRSRLVPGSVLALFALPHLVGGAWLLSLGGSFYYLIAGLLLAVSAMLTLKSDQRGEKIFWIYLALTIAWALWETGISLWGLQARLTLPLAIAVLVAWPCLRHHWKSSLAAAVLVLALSVGSLIAANRWDAPPAAETLPVAGKGDWLHYGNTCEGTRFSPLTEITPQNVANLEHAWTYHTNVASGMGFEATPLMVKDTLYVCTANNVVHAINPETGTDTWIFDPKTDTPPTSACRGVAYYKVENKTGHCADRIIFATSDARLMAIDTQDGKPCRDFGTNGSVDLKHRMGEVDKGYYFVSSAPAIVRGKAVVGGWVLDGQYVGEPSGVIRAFDAVTGEFAWAWDMDKPDFHDEPPEGETYSRGTANSWGPMSGDEELSMVYLPTGNSTPDYWGAHRSEGSEKYSSSVIALDAETGHAVWHFQTAHHDVWDYDVSAQPTLVDLEIDGEQVPALIQATKRGEVFLLDRRNGNLLADVEERPVPQGPAEGDWLSSTQPFSVGMPSFDDTVLTEQQMWGLSSLDQLWCRIKFKQARYEGPMTPPGVKPTITYPSYLGGINWGGVSVDTDRNLMVANWSRVANYTQLIPREKVPHLQISTSGGIHVGEPVPQMGTPFALETFAFLSPLGVPCTSPPFGKIGVVDLDSRELIWEKPLGTGADSGPFEIPTKLPIPMGVPNAGGSLTTRSGLIFIGATQEKALRAFHTETGKLLWKHRLPAGGHASPMSFLSPESGDQFIVIAAGGSAPLHSGAADTLVAFRLKK